MQDRYYFDGDRHQRIARDPELRQRTTDDYELGRRARRQIEDENTPRTFIGLGKPLALTGEQIANDLHARIRRWIVTR